MSTDEVLQELVERGLRPALIRGELQIIGDRKQATPTVLAVLRWHREAIKHRLNPQPVRVKEWRWNSGHTYTSDGAEPADWHPVGAWWWRYQGEAEWREIPERIPYLRGNPPEYVPTMRQADRFQTAERR